MRLILPAALILTACVSAQPPALPAEIKLYEGKAPGAVGGHPSDTPTLTPYLVPKEKANGTAVVVCPGGGYGFLAMGHEGKDVAKWLNDRGVAAFVLKYRIASKDRPGPLMGAPLGDAQRAIRHVRANADKFGVDAKKIGIWGFSAGGHLASTATVRFDAGDPSSDDAVAKASSRPDFSILAYPVITMGPSTHGGSKKNLIGDRPSAELMEKYSNEKHVTKETPPVFIFHTVEDKAVPIENAKLFQAAAEKAGVPVELFVTEKGQHGLGLAPDHPDAKVWPEKLEAWMRGLKLVR